MLQLLLVLQVAWRSCATNTVCLQVVWRFGAIIIIKCMCSGCRRDDIHVCFAYASPQRMPHMYDHKIVSLKYIILIENN